MNEANKRSNNGAATDLLSPELALVDPDLARVARSRMPDHPDEVRAVIPRPPAGNESERSPPRTLQTAIASRRPRPPAATIGERSAPPLAPPPSEVVSSGASAPQQTAHEERPAGLGELALERQERRPAWRPVSLPPVLLLAAAALALVGVALAAVKLSGDDRGSNRPETTAAASGGPSQGEEPREENGRPSPPAAVATPRSAPPTTARPRSTPSPASAGRPAPRVFVWLPVRGASHYKVEFFRSGRKIFEATPSQPRLQLPERWTFNGRRFTLTPGSYRWSVRPGFGSRSKPRYGRAIVASRLTLPQ